MVGDFEKTSFTDAQKFLEIKLLIAIQKKSP